MCLSRSQIINRGSSVCLEGTGGRGGQWEEEIGMKEEVGNEKREEVGNWIEGGNDNRNEGGSGKLEWGNKLELDQDWQIQYKTAKVVWHQMDSILQLFTFICLLKWNAVFLSAHPSIHPSIHLPTAFLISVVPGSTGHRAGVHPEWNVSYQVLWRRRDVILRRVSACW